MTRLSQLVDAAAGSSVSLPDLLRQVRVVASRTGASDLDLWAAGELAGFPHDAVVPSYRGPFLAPARGTWVSMTRYVENTTITPVGVSPTFRDTWFMVTMRQPVAELESLASGADDAKLPWDPTAVGLYDQEAQAGKVAHPLGHHLMSAHTIVPRNHILGVLDTMRTRVLELALELERVSIDVGEPGGPTVADAQVAAAAQTLIINVYGDGANIATGDYARLRNQVRRGDEQALRAAVEALGLTARDAEEFVDGLREDGSAVGGRTASFLDRVRRGAVVLSTNIAASLVADQLIALAQAFLGG